MYNKIESDTEYSRFVFFNPENTERYKKYAALNPNMNADDIVWRVNNNLDKEKYEYDVLVSDCDNPYIIVNKYFKLPEDYCPPDLVDADGCLMRKDTAEAYIRMRDKAKEEGFSISVVWGYRSIQDQKMLYDRFLRNSTVSEVDKTCARPCYSEHHTGMAIDIQGSIPGGRNISKTPEAAWLRENCYKFGFILRYLPEIVEITGYEPEPWHLRYVGVEVSTDMKERNIKSFEEYNERFLKITNT